MIEAIAFDKAKSIMGQSFIGPDELKSVKILNFADFESVPEIPFSPEKLEEKKDDYLLILGVDKFSDGKTVTIRNLRDILGQDPEKMEPCFYNQDWYDMESFIDEPVKLGWYLIRKSVYEESRSVQPNELAMNYSFPSAITCTYTFFVTWFCRGIKLWYHDFVWCSDVDHNGDRIYVGKYHDVDGVNKNGFSIHRHLELRTCYGCID